MTSPKTEQLNIDLWLYGQLNGQRRSQMGATIWQQRMMQGGHFGVAISMHIQMFSQMDDHTRHGMEYIDDLP